jgi:hypothetical protein
VDYLPNPWEEGWQPWYGNLGVRFSSKGFSPGLWEVRVKGTMERDKTPWESEPKEFRIPESGK